MSASGALASRDSARSRAVATSFECGSPRGFAFVPKENDTVHKVFGCAHLSRASLTLSPHTHTGGGALAGALPLAQPPHRPAANGTARDFRSSRGTWTRSTFISTLVINYNQGSSFKHSWYMDRLDCCGLIDSTCSLNHSSSPGDQIVSRSVSRPPSRPPGTRPKCKSP